MAFHVPLWVRKGLLVLMLALAAVLVLALCDPLQRTSLVLERAAGFGEARIFTGSPSGLLIGLTPQARISPQAARALVQAELGPVRVAVLALPPQTHYEYYLAVLLFLGGGTRLVKRWHLLARLRRAWRRA